MEGTKKSKGEVPDSTEVVNGDPYTVRPFEPGDIDEFLSLYESVWGRRKTRDWFDWKYGHDNPFYDEIPVLVVDNGGELVGAKPHVAIRMRAGDATRIGLIGTDTMVHEDHRRRGLFDRLVERTLERYADREPVLTFNYPNDKSRQGYRNRGWNFLGNRNTSAYRVHDPKPVVRQFGGRASVVTAPLAGLLARGAYSLLDSLRESADDVTVERNPPDPPAKLGAVPRRTGEPRLHAERDETFYRWWLDGAGSGMADTDDGELVERTCYVAYRGDDPIAGAIAITYALTEPVLAEYFEYDAVTEIIDVTPVADEQRTDGLVRVLERLLADARDSRYVSVPENALSEDLRRAFGFVSQTHPRISWISDPPGPLALRPLGNEFTVDEATITDPHDWIVTNAEYR